MRSTSAYETNNLNPSREVGSRMPPREAAVLIALFSASFRAPVEIVSKHYYKEALGMLAWRASLQRADQP